MIPKKEKNLLGLNVFIHDKAENDKIIKECKTKEDAEEFIEAFERPQDLRCSFNRAYKECQLEEKL